MASLIPGYEYDIFISYRQKDNKHDGWVTEFVENLKGELESTFKEDVSVYFDINPHDGLLETHDVDESLKEKLKCLVFIPIISRTYCDSKSFAWEHEFRAFIDQAGADQFGLKVKLPVGNVASRVLPIQIHELEQEDKNLLEVELGGYIRGVEFIYREPGVNKPLTPDDDEKKNLNKTRYSYQINKVANAIKEIINGIKYAEHTNIARIDNNEGIVFHPIKKLFWKASAIFATLVLIAVLGIFFIPGLIKPSPEIEKSIAVLPFINDSPDKEGTDYIINGLLDEIINDLQKIKSFSKVLPRTSVEKYRNTTKSATEIGKELDVNFIINGSAIKLNNHLNLKIFLINAKKNNVLKSFPYNENITNTEEQFTIYTLIAQSVAEELKAEVTPDEIRFIKKIPTTNLTAYDFNQRGYEELVKFRVTGNNEILRLAEGLFIKALRNDSTFAKVYCGLGWIYYYRYYWKTLLNEDFLDSVLILSNKALQLNNELSDAYTLKGYYYYRLNDFGKSEAEFFKALKYNSNDYLASFGLGEIYYFSSFINSIKYYQKALSLDKGRTQIITLSSLARTFINAGFPDKAKELYATIYSLDKDSTNLISNLEFLEYSLGNYGMELELDKKLYLSDSTNINTIWNLATDNLYLRKFKDALFYFQKYFEKSPDLNSSYNFFHLHRIAFCFYSIGQKEKGDIYLNKEIENCEKLKLLDRNTSYKNRPYYDLAGAYALKGDKGKAFLNLKSYAKQEHFLPEMINLIKHDPLFDNIRNDPEFQQIVKEMDTKYLAEHEKVRKWLEDNKML